MISLGTPYDLNTPEPFMCSSCDYPLGESELDLRTLEITFYCDKCHAVTTVPVVLQWTQRKVEVD